ncbi:MAG: hypothetical protein COA50_02345 [Flavobacteriaceae bacterium]|nr:MAG: hypothetical protein COA50_02345 [Flavobacteriaceae bacterium]
MAYNITLEGKNLDAAEKLLAQATSVFESCKVNYWLEGGTLLGLYRENRLLPWDDDIDISIHNNQGEKIQTLLSTLKENGFRIRIRTFNNDSDYFKKGDIRMIKIRTKHFFGLFKGKVCLDVFIKYTTHDKTYWKIGDKTKNVPSIFYEAFKTIEFKEKSYQIPKNTEDYLTYRYGEWQTPVKNWDTSKDDKALIPS